MSLIARRESFGGIVGDSEAYGFHVVNRSGFKLLKELSNGRSVELMKTHGSEPAYRTFLGEVWKRGWCDEGGRFLGRIVDNGNDVPFLSAPIRVWLEVTSRCNISCAQCINQNHKEYLQPDLPFEAIATIIDDLHRSAVLQITVTGGEPLLRKDIFAILDLIVERQFGLRFFTNGTTLTEKNAARLSEYPISHLFLSIDGIGSSNDLLRGANTYEKIKRGLSILAPKVKNITLSTTLHRFSSFGIEELFALAKEHGVRLLLIRPLFQCRANQTSMFIPPGDMDKVLTALEVASAKYQVEYQANKLPFRQIKKSVYFLDDPKDVHFSYFSQHNTFGCVGGNTVVGIKANGVIMACGFVPYEYPKEGNSVLERTFLDLWNKSENVTLLRDLPGNAVCNNCGLLPVCGGGCRANALLYMGDINAVDPYCFWVGKTRSNIPDRAEPHDYAGAPIPYLSERAIITKCGSGTQP